jgi:hypothetical protein
MPDQAANVIIAAPWDALTAIGTLALAAVTAVAVIVTLMITRQDRRLSAAERARADERIRDERLHSLQLEQDQQASDVYLTRTAIDPQATADKLALIVSIINGGDYTITHVMVQFSISGDLTEPVRAEYIPASVTSGLVADTDTLGYTDVLTPGTGLRVVARLVKSGEAGEVVPVVRWTDRWEQR